jgi:hypothetical protein
VIRRYVLAVLAAGLVFAGTILSRYADLAVPPDFVVRPLAVSVLIALPIGAVGLIAGRHAAIVAAAIAGVAVLAQPPVVFTVIASAVVFGVASRRGWTFPATQSAALLLAGTFVVIGLVRAVGVTSLPSVSSVSAQSLAATGPPTYLVLLDGYPRLDTLHDLGIDNRGFVAALEARGFDHYPAAESRHGWTHKTLLALLTGHEAPDTWSSVEETREIRQQLVVPPGFLAIDPPAGHAVLNGGPHVNAGGITDFEATLLAYSAVAVVAPDWAWGEMVGSLRMHLESSLATLETTDAPLVFAHLLAPHPPFLFGAAATDVGACWPGCQLFDNDMDRLGMTRDEWAAAMADQLHGLNDRIIASIDRIRRAHPNAVIVLFSDHGARYSAADPAEWHQSFLAARTPGHPRLFESEPRPDAILRLVEEAYGPPSS